jgi:hypothetical protein
LPFLQFQGAVSFRFNIALTKWRSAETTAKVTRLTLDAARKVSQEITNAARRQRVTTVARGDR